MYILEYSVIIMNIFDQEMDDYQMLQMFDSMYMMVRLDETKVEPPPSPEKPDRSNTAGLLAKPVDNDGGEEQGPTSKQHAAPESDGVSVQKRPLPTPCRAARPEDADDHENGSQEDEPPKKTLTRQDLFS